MISYLSNIVCKLHDEWTKLFWWKYNVGLAFLGQSKKKKRLKWQQFARATKPACWWTWIEWSTLCWRSQEAQRSGWQSSLTLSLGHLCIRSWDKLSATTTVKVRKVRERYDAHWGGNIVPPQNSLGWVGSGFHFFWKWLTNEQLTMFKRVHEVWMSRTLKNNVWL